MKPMINISIIHYNLSVPGDSSLTCNNKIICCWLVYAKVDVNIIALYISLNTISWLLKRKIKIQRRYESDRQLQNIYAIPTGQISKYLNDKFSENNQSFLTVNYLITAVSLRMKYSSKNMSQSVEFGIKKI